MKLTPYKTLSLSFLLCLFLSACGGEPTRSGLTPFPEKHDLNNEKIGEAVEIFLKNKMAPPNSEYDYARTDLNGDGNREAIVLFKLPHNYWCGWDGCGMLVLKAGKEHFTPLSLIGNVRGPIYIVNDTNQGWRNIVIRTSGNKTADRNIELTFDGRTYPHTPLLAPTRNAPLNMQAAEMFFR